ncbi:hypothetical protein [Ekhidna sp.]
MDTSDQEFDNDYSDFDDRIEIEEYYLQEINDESEPVRDDDLYYRHLEEY